MTCKQTTISLAALVAAAFFTMVPAMAQDATASIHGHANNPIGQVLKNDQIKLSKDLTGDARSRKFTYTFQTDDNGDYKGTGIAPGTYFIVLMEGDKNLDYIPSQKFVAGEDKKDDFDLSRPDYIAKMSPEEKATLEEYKKKNAEATSTNSKITNVNALLISVRADLASKTPNYDQDVAQMKGVTDTLPGEGLLWLSYANALYGRADHQAAQDRIDHKSPLSDDAVMKDYQDGIDASRKGIDLNAASKKPNLVDQAAGWNAIGSAYGKSGKISEAQDAYTQAVKDNPAGAGLYYGNMAAVLFNAGNVDAANAAADKAIAADPTKPNPYYIKGQSLVGKATVDKSGKIVAPPECIAAYQKYLELAPDGADAPTVREILTAMGEKINTKYTAGKKN